MSIKRYYICDYLPNGDATPPITVERDDGWLCLYADHAAVLAAKDAEIAALRERCERLRSLGIAAVHTMNLFAVFVPSTHARLVWAERTMRRKDDCDIHNDLQPPAGKESNDG